MIRKKTMLGLLLSFSIIMSMTTGCSSSKNTSADTENVSQTAVTENSLPLTDKPVTLKYWVTNASSEQIKNYNETLSMQEIERKTGVHIEFIHPTAGQEQQAFNLMLASDDMPDIIQEREGTIYYPGGPDKAIADGVYLKLNDLIEKYAPNYSKLMSKNPTVAKLTVTDSGNRWAFFHLTDGAEPAWTGFVVRKDMLDKVGLKTPVTLDDWHEVLTAFKTKLNVEAPLLLPNTGVPLFNQILSAWDIGGSFYQVNGKVKYGPCQPEYKEYLTLMNQWYKEGLIDKDFMGRTDAGFEIMAPANLAASNKTGMFSTLWGLTANAYIIYGNVKDNPDFYLEAIQAPKKTPDQKIKFNYPSYEVREGTAITKSCKNPILAVKWLDYLYTEEGSNIVNYGKENDTFILKDGKPVWTDKVLKASGDLTPNAAMHKYARWDGPGVVDYKRMWQVYNASGQSASLEACNVWAKDGIDYVMPPVTLTSDESSEFSNIMPDITTYVNEMTVKFIIGTEPLSKFDDFVKQINNMRIEEAIKIQQTALDRFNNRK
ncbi:extracellular solute-binding protein [Clostridium sp. SYSU_GA19001]|uniref:extracellular solute-binding protein n=1 Tax=Clostridium caldaquaticum TaxID=2940653 RepID=UPI00207744EC|nr:extracellular solute-binding protein [Clostridium caldaquaticum]MCM8711701.1 extracellular solute-binding protein [Clostridium caldaquaticum]